MGGAVAVRRLQLVANVAIGRKRQPLLEYRRAADIAAQAFELLTFIGPSRFSSRHAELLNQNPHRSSLAAIHDICHLCHVCHASLTYLACPTGGWDFHTNKKSMT